MWLCQSGSVFVLVTAGLPQQAQAQELETTQTLVERQHMQTLATFLLTSSSCCYHGTQVYIN